MGNKQNVEQVNHCSDLLQLAEEYDESDTGTNILNKLDVILTLLKSGDKNLARQLNKKQKNWEVIIKLLGHSNNKIAIACLQIISYAFVFHETVEFFKAKKNPHLPDIIKKMINMFAMLYLSQDFEVQLEAAKTIEDICIHVEFKLPILNSGLLANLLSAVKEDDDLATDPKNANPQLKLFHKTCLKAILNLLKNEKDDKVKVALINLKASTTLTIAFSKTSNQEIFKIIASIFALLSQSSECREDLIINSCIEECVRIYKLVDVDESKLIFVRVLANLSENDLGINKIKKSQVVNMLFEAMKETRHKGLIYHILMAFMLFSRDPDIYKLLMRNKFLTMLETISIFSIKDQDQVFSLLYGLKVFTKRATESNLSELFLIIINPLWLYLRREVSDLECINMAITSMANLSLRRDFQLYVATSEFFDKFIDYGEKLIESILKFKEDIEYDILVNYTKVLSNVFINTNNKFLCLNDNYLKLLKNLKVWVINANTPPKDEKNLETQFLKEIHEHAQIKEISDDLCLVDAMQFTHIYVEDEELNKLKFALKMVRSDNAHTACKAASVCAHMALESEKRRILVEKKIVDHMIYLLSMKENSVVREGASGIANILQFPDDMILWLKFDSNRLQIDAASNFVLLLHGKPKNLIEDKGLYENWGCWISDGDVFEVPGEGIHIENKLSVCFWFSYPMPDKKKYHTLLQGKDGIGGQFVVDDTMEVFGVFDEKTGDFLTVNFDSKSLKRGWNHAIITYDNENSKITFYFNGKQAKSPINTVVKEPIKYIGNSKDKREPFGVLCDFRIYANILSLQQIKEISNYNEKQENFPDKLCDLINHSKGIEDLLKALTNPFCEAQTEACRALAALASKQSCKMEILRLGGFEFLTKLLNDNHMPLRIEASKAILHLS